MFWFYRLGATPAGYGQFIFDNANYWAEVVQSGEWGIYGDYTTTPIPTNEWHHLAYRKTSGGNIELYQDGVLVLTTSISFSLNLAATWTVGYGGDGPINGRMDDLRIFNVALTQSQIEDYSAVPVASWTAPPPILPIAEYGFNEGSGAYARDSSGNNRTIAVDSSKWVASKNGSGLSDIGFQNAVMGAANLTARTIMMWVALEELPPTNGYYDLINTGLLEDNGAFDSIYINNSSVNGMQLSYYSTNGAGSESDTSFNVVVTAEPFAHIAISTGPGGLKAYFNGEFVGSTPALTRTFGASSVHMSYPGTHELKGNIDDLRIFDHELTEAQIASWMDVPVTGTTAGLAVLPVAEYGFTEGSGTTTADTSGNNKTITVQSSSWTASGKNNSALSGVGFTNANMGSATPSARTLMFWTKISAPPAYSDRFDIIRTGDLYGGENGDIVYFHKGSPDIYPTEVGLYYYYESSDGSHSYDKGYDVIIPANTFVHVAVVNGEGGAQLYFNGTIQGIVTANTVVPGLESVSMSTASYTSSGLVIDELRVFDRELTPEQINYWMNTPIGPTEQRVAFRGRSGGVTQTYVRAAVRISGQTVPIVNGAIRLGGATVPLRLEAGDPSPFDVLGSSTSGRVGSGSLSVPLPSGTGGSVLIFLSGNQLSEPTVPAGWTKVNWSVANPALATGIYQHNSPSSNPTFNVTQALDGGIAAIAFRIRGSITNVSALGASDVVVSPSTTSVNQSLVIRTLVSNLDSPVETNITFPPGTTYQQFQLIGGVDAGAMVAAAASPVIAPATPSGTATWTLNNIDTSRAATWLIELS